MRTKMSSPAEDHIGFLIRWTQRAVKSKWFEDWTFEDILSEAFLRSDFLLKEKYDPKKGTPTVFLGSCLRTDLSYTYQRYLGRTIHWVKKEDGGRRRTWVQKAPSVDCLDSISPGVDFENEVDFSEIELTIRERKIISMLMESRTRADIADRLGISTSRVGQIINESIRPKINDWVREAPTLEQDPPAPYTQRGIS
jgi:DNA-directed RNA polymerase specialized sigma24 family protein